MRRQGLNVFRIQMLGAKVVPVESGSKTLKDAVNEAMRDWVTNLATTHYLVGSCIGPHPFPTIVRDFQRVIGKEIKEQLREATGKLPDAVIACVGGGSNAIGTFFDFIPDKEVRLIGVEAGGDGEFRGTCCLMRHAQTGQGWTDTDTARRSRPENQVFCMGCGRIFSSRQKDRSWRHTRSARGWIILELVRNTLG